MTPTPPDKELDEIIEKLTFHQEPPYVKDFPADIRYTMSKAEAKQAINRLIAKERLDEAEQHRVQWIDIDNYDDYYGWMLYRKSELEQSLKESKDV